MNATQRNAVLDAMKAMQDRLHLVIELHMRQLATDRSAEPVEDIADYIDALKRTIAELKEGL
jgi:hypothetical protein